MSTWKDRHNEGVRLLAAGDLAGARATLEEALATASGQDRPRCLLNLAHAVDLAGDRQHAVDLMTEALTQAEEPLRTLIVASRADLLMMAGRFTEAERDATAALDLAAQHAPEFLANLHTTLALLAEEAGDERRAENPSPADDRSGEAAARATRARILAGLGRYADAADAAHTALDLAYAAAPTLVASIHATLAEIASGTGDLSGAADLWAMVRDLCAATGDVQGEAGAVLSSARLAYLSSDADRADALYDEAENLRADDPHWRALCLLGRSAVAILRDEPREALGLLDQSQASLGPTPLELIGVEQLRGSAFEALGEYAAADDCFARASARCDAAGLWHVALGMTWWRADAMVRRAAAVTGAERRALAERALDLALPAALASEAVRQRFPHGPLREKWVALASAPAVRTAFLAIRAVEDSALAAEYIDHLAGAVSLHADGATPVPRTDVVSLPLPPDVPAELPYAASGVNTGPVTAAGFELPPRVRLDPAVPSTLDSWIDVAEERYGFPVRSARAVASW